MQLLRSVQQQHDVAILTLAPSAILALQEQPDKYASTEGACCAKVRLWCRGETCILQAKAV